MVEDDEKVTSKFKMLVWRMSRNCR